LPRWLALILSLFVWLVVVPLVHAGLPWALSLIGPRYGWEEGHPSAWNRLGLFPVIFAAVWLIWILSLHLARMPERVELGWAPPLLLTGGPYAFTRNPMYVGELALWLGWAIFFGSVAVLTGFLLLCIVVDRVVLPREERSLETRFGQVYCRYKSTVPRWFGKWTLPDS
jgi:protein-S-isoprenylcysteine O-methyltransferase Ste14